MQIRCNFPEISYLSETQKNNFQFLRYRITQLEFLNFECFSFLNEMLVTRVEINKMLVKITNGEDVASEAV